MWHLKGRQALCKRDARAVQPRDRTALSVGSWGRAWEPDPCEAHLGGEDG